jgi:Ca2+-binding EF-hand superfamily protein
MKTWTKVMLAGAAGLIAAGSIAVAQTPMGWRHGPRMEQGDGMSSGWMGHMAARHMINELFARYDTNKDGAITQDEIDQARTGTLSTYDTDKSGSLSLAEFQNLWLAQQHERMVRAFQFLDRDGDGQITKDEYLQPLANLVTDHDQNGDGKLTIADRPQRPPMDGDHMPYRHRMMDNGDNGDEPGNNG